MLLINIKWIYFVNIMTIFLYTCVKELNLRIKFDRISNISNKFLVDICIELVQRLYYNKYNLCWLVITFIYRKEVLICPR